MHQIGIRQYHHGNCGHYGRLGKVHQRVLRRPRKNKHSNLPISFEGDLSGPKILELEIEQAVKQLKVGKAKGQDNISCEMLRTLKQDGVGVLCKLFNQIYNQGVIPEEM